MQFAGLSNNSSSAHFINIYVFAQKTFLIFCEMFTHDSHLSHARAREKENVSCVKNLGWFAIAGGLSRPKLLFSSPDGSTLSSSGLYTRFLTANQSTQSMVFKNIQILSKSFWWIGECCAENSNIFISTSTPRLALASCYPSPGPHQSLKRRSIQRFVITKKKGPTRCQGLLLLESSFHLYHI